MSQPIITKPTPPRPTTRTLAAPATDTQARIHESVLAHLKDTVGLLLFALPLFIYWIFFNNDNKMPSQFNVIVGKPASDHESAPRRNYRSKDGLWTVPKGVSKENGTTIYRYFKEKATLQAKSNCMASRQVVAIHHETRSVDKMVDGKKTTVKKPWVLTELSPYSYQTFDEVLKIVDNFAAGIVKAGVRPAGAERFHIYAATSAEWLQSAIALCSQGIPVVTAYDTLGESGLIHSMVQCKTVGVLTDNVLLSTLAGPLKKGVDTIRIVVTTKPLSAADKEEVENLREIAPKLEVYSFDQIVALGAANPSEPHLPSADDVAVIMYTSGSTGPPKGVVLTQGNVMAGVAGVTGVIEKDVLVGSTDRVLAMLPLAHILEFTMELCSFQWGSVLGYGNPRTMSDANVKNCKGDVREFQPTVMVGVPMVWEAVRKGIMAKVKSVSGIQQKIFWGAFHAKVGLSKFHLPLPLESLLFKKVREATGGKLRYCFNGGAAVSADTQIFITNLIAPLLIGYGLTETNANTSLMPPECFDIGIQGEFTTAIEGKLVDVAEAGYFAKNGQGELYLKGPSIAKGYFMNEEETAEGYDGEWFKTGDIAEWTSNGCIKLIDRRKNLVKTLHGEYIALERLESVYRSCSFVANICVYADQDHAKPVAIIVPNEPAVKAFCEEKNIPFHEDVAHDEVIKRAILIDMVDAGKRQGLKGIELLDGIVVSKVEWTPQNGFLSSAQKLQRKLIVKDNESEIKQAYRNS